MIRLFNRKTEAERKMEAIERLRMEMMSWGYDISDLSDEDIEKGMIQVGNALRACGGSLSDVEQVFKDLIITTRKEL